MIIVISPSKTLDDKTPSIIKEHFLPQLLHESKTLMQTCKSLSVKDIEKLMKISTKLAELNYQRFQKWQPELTSENAKQAISSFKGDVYEGLHVEDFSDNELTFTQQHLRILSGLYGLLRPLDLMLPYRLEMGIKLKNQNNKDLYQFWGDKITEQLNHDIENDAPLINLSSNEYFKAINLNKLKSKVIHPVFLDESKGQYKVISFYAKKARGLMSRYIIKHQLVQCEDLKSFDLEGYQFDSSLSDNVQWTFKRSELMAKKQKHS